MGNLFTTLEVVVAAHQNAPAETLLPFVTTVIDVPTEDNGLNVCALEDCPF